MRRVVLFCFALPFVASCARSLPATSETTAADLATGPAPIEATSDPILVPARSARELIDEMGLATLLEDRALVEAVIDPDAMERWFARPPASLYFYSERAVEVGPEQTVGGDCQRVQRWDSGVLNALSIVVWQAGRLRTVVTLGQDRVSVQEQTRARGRWETNGVRGLPMRAVAWDDDHIRYAEGAEGYELACVPALRTLPCGEEPIGGRGYCVDRELVVRPWRAPTVPHVGPVISAYQDAVPEAPESDCAIRCEPSACDEALRTAVLPSAPLYPVHTPVLAAFRSAAACRAFATTRAESRREAIEEQPW
jgi:hypothetical protein